MTGAIVRQKLVALHKQLNQAFHKPLGYDADRLGHGDHCAYVQTVLVPTFRRFLAV
jgi:hypothetical protein